MKFLKQNYDKLLLGVVLVIFSAITFVIVGNLTKARSETPPGVVALGGKLPDVLTEEGSQETLNGLKSYEMKVSVQNKAKGNLFEPDIMIVCFNKDCKHLLPYNIDKCPYCGNTQFPKKMDLNNINLDNDRDGIPDKIEKRYDFLSALNPLDAKADQDDDGFSNLIEYKYRTSMNNDRETPEFAVLLRCLTIVKRPYPVQFEGVEKFGHDDSNRWSLQFKCRGKDYTVSVGDEVEGFKIDTAESIDGGFLAKLSKNGEVLKLTTISDDKDPERSAKIMMMRYRTRRNVRRNKIFWVKNGQDFAVKFRLGEEQKFKVTFMSNTSVKVRSVRTGREFDIVKYSKEKDLVNSNSSRIRR